MPQCRYVLLYTYLHTLASKQSLRGSIAVSTQLQAAPVISHNSHNSHNRHHMTMFGHLRQWHVFCIFLCKVSTSLLSASIWRLLLPRPLPIKLMAGGSMGTGEFFANSISAYLSDNYWAKIHLPSKLYCFFGAFRLIGGTPLAYFSCLVICWPTF